MACLERCPECPSRKIEDESQHKTPVFGDGPDDAEIVGIGEAPGREENNRHRPFLGKAGGELNETYLPLAGLTRSEVYLTNTVKCHWADGGDAPPDSLAKSCAEFHLSRELRAINPKIVILMGSTSHSLLGWDVDMEHGIYHTDVKLLGWRGDIYSTYHPALGLHMGNKMQALLDDFKLLRRYRDGDLQPLKIVGPDAFVNERLYFASQVRKVFSKFGYWRIAIDTEAIKRWRGFKRTIKYTPDRVTFCIEAPYGFMIMRKDEDAMAEFNRQIQEFSTIYMHNAPYDEWACGEMGVQVPFAKVKDTMAMAYHDGRLARGLKSLALRLAGIRMTSFDDVVVPHGYERAMDYLADARRVELPGPIQEPTGEHVIRNCPDCKGKGVLGVGRGKSRKVYPCECDEGKVVVPAMTKHQGLAQAISRVFTDFAKGPVKVWERWESWTEKDHMLPALHKLIGAMGPIPLPSIDYVPEDEAMVYACGDAIGTRIIGPTLSRRVAEIRRRVR